MAFEIIKLIYLLTIFMAALRGGWGHYILSRFFLPSFSFFLSFFLLFSRLITAVADWMTTILLHVHMVWPIVRF